MKATTYYATGHDPSLAPGMGRVEEADSASGLLIRWNADGSQASQRRLTTQEAADLAEQDTRAAEQTNGNSLVTQAASALDANRTFIASSPNNAQTLTQVKALTRQMNALIRLTLNQLDGTD